MCLYPNAFKVWPASGTGSNLLPLFALFTDEMPIATLEDATRWWHHLSLKMSKVEIWVFWLRGFYLIANWALKIFLKDRIARDGWWGWPTHPIQPVKRVQLTLRHLRFHHHRTSLDSVLKAIWTCLGKPVYTKMDEFSENFRRGGGHCGLTGRIIKNLKMPKKLRQGAQNSGKITSIVKLIKFSAIHWKYFFSKWLPWHICV